MCFTLIKLWLSNGAFLILPLLSVTFSHAQQVLQTNRYELAVRENEYFEVVPAAQDGIFLYRELSSTNDDKIELIKLDTALKEQWKGHLPVDKQMTVISRRVDRGKLFLLFRYLDPARNDMELFTVDQRTGKYLKFPIRNFIPYSPIFFQVTEKAAIIGGYYNSDPIVVFYNLDTQQSKILPNYYNANLQQAKLLPNIFNEPLH